MIRTILLVFWVTIFFLGTLAQDRNIMIKGVWEGRNKSGEITKIVFSKNNEYYLEIYGANLRLTEFKDGHESYPNKMVYKINSDTIPNQIDFYEEGKTNVKVKGSLKFISEKEIIIGLDKFDQQKRPKSFDSKNANFSNFIRSGPNAL